MSNSRDSDYDFFPDFYEHDFYDLDAETTPLFDTEIQQKKQELQKLTSQTQALEQQRQAQEQYLQNLQAQQTQLLLALGNSATAITSNTFMATRGRSQKYKKTNGTVLVLDISNPEKKVEITWCGLFKRFYLDPFSNPSIRLKTEAMQSDSFEIGEDGKAYLTRDNVTKECECLQANVARKRFPDSFPKKQNAPKEIAERKKRDQKKLPGTKSTHIFLDTFEPVPFNAKRNGSDTWNNIKVSTVDGRPIIIKKSPRLKKIYLFVDSINIQNPRKDDKSYPYEIVSDASIPSNREIISIKAYIDMKKALRANKIQTRTVLAINQHGSLQECTWDAIFKRRYTNPFSDPDDPTWVTVDEMRSDSFNIAANGLAYLSYNGETRECIWAKKHKKNEIVPNHVTTQTNTSMANEYIPNAAINQNMGNNTTRTAAYPRIDLGNNNLPSLSTAQTSTFFRVPPPPTVGVKRPLENPANTAQGSKKTHTGPQ